MSTAPAPRSPEPARRDPVGAALRTFFRLSAAWGLDTRQEMTLLGQPGRSTFFRWKRGDVRVVPGDVLERISYLLGIYKALHILFPDPAQADGWIRRPNAAPAFGGASALERMLAGQVADLFVVRQYLDAQRGWG